MRVLVACEFSGVVRDAFGGRGHDAWSCDLLETERPGNHYVADVREVLRWESWDLMVAHPPCTYLCNSGVRWLHERGGRWDEMVRGAEFVKELLEAGVERIAVENPIPHSYAVRAIGRKYDQLVQPWWFGEGSVKGICLWLKGLSPLLATVVHPGRDNALYRCMPGPERWKIRSRTFEGIAVAMASQWG